MKNRKAKETKTDESEKAEKDVCIEPKSETDLLYDVDSTPPIGIIIFYGFQIVIVNVCYCILMSMLIGQLICADYQFTSRLFSTICVLAGLTTMLQTGLGARMPIFHGPSIVFILPYMFASSDPRWGCKKDADDAMNGAMMNMTSNATEIGQELWEIEWEKITGSLMVAHVVEMCVGLSGILALLLKVIRPITIGSIFILIAVYVHNVVSDFAQVHWGLSTFSILLIVIISQYLNGVNVPAPYWSRKEGFHWIRFPLFALFPVLISVIITWIFAIILTAAGAFPDDPTDIRYNARTDINMDNIDKSPVFRVPYPGQFGVSFDLEYFLVFLVSILTTVVESFGSYHQYALSCQLPSPPAHAINRGILTEAVGGLLAASCGMGCATTTYGNMVGIIRITKVASRKVYITGGFILIFVGLFTKIGAFLCTIPKPVLAGPVFIGIALLAGAAFANFHATDLARPRNQATLGISLLAGVFLPFWIIANPAAIDTGSTIGDRVLNAILGVPFLVGGVVACVLDSTLPGPRDDPSKMPAPPLETADDQEKDDIERAIEKDSYDPRIRLFDPPFVGKYMRSWRISRYIPIFPNPDLLKRGRANGDTLKMRRENGGLTDGHVDDDNDMTSFKIDAETWYKMNKTDV